MKKKMAVRLKLPEEVVKRQLSFMFVTHNMIQQKSTKRPSP